MLNINTNDISNIIDKIKKGIALNKDEKIFYQGSTDILKSNVKFIKNKKENEEYNKCKKSCIYFIENYVKIMHINNPKSLLFTKFENHGKKIISYNNIKLRKYQVDMINHYLQNKFTLFNKSRQIGHSTIMAAVYIWEVIFNDKKVMHLSYSSFNSHIFMDKMRDMYSNLPHFLKLTVKNFNKYNIITFNGGSIKSISSNSKNIDKDFDILSIDDYKLNNNCEKILKDNYSKKIKITISDNFSMMSKKHYGELLNSYNFNDMHFNWNIVPGRDSKWKQKTINEVGIHMFNISYSVF